MKYCGKLLERCDMKEKEIPVVKRRARENFISTRVSTETFKNVYRVSAETGFTMSEIARLCIERALPAVEKVLHELKRAK